VPRKVPQVRFLTFVALIKSSLGQRFALDGRFQGQPFRTWEQRKFGAILSVQALRNASRRNGFEAKKNAATEAAALSYIVPLT